MAQISKHAKRGLDKILFSGPHYTSAVYPETAPARIFLRFQDTQGEIAFTAEFDEDEAEAIAKHFGEYVAKAECLKKGQTNGKG